MAVAAAIALRRAWHGAHASTLREASSGFGLRPAELAEREAYVSAAERFFRPELFNRIDRIVPFERLRRDDVARIEFAPEEMPRALNVEMFDTLGREFKRIGYRFVAVDVQGYRSGALNEVLTSIQVPSR